MSKYEQLKEIIVKAILDIPYIYFGKDTEIRELTLEDVLITLHKTDIWAIDLEGEFFRQDMYCGEPIYTDIKWRFGKPLSQQPEETIEFLLELLS